MGNIVEKISSHKSESVLGASIVALLYYLYKESQEKAELKDLLRAALTGNKANEGADFANTLNQVYLKDHVEHFSIRNNSEHPIYKIAITGGPCAGKSTSLEKIKTTFAEQGFRVLAVPEIPTLVVLSGGMILMSKFNIQERIKFQSLLIRFQMYTEDYFTRLAEMSKSPAIVLCDRGTVDPAAYVSKEEFQAIMDEEGWSWITLRDRRYDRVIFLNSAANGAEEHYSLANNVARSEGLEVARNLDKKTLDAWTGHPHLTVVPNVKGQSFQDKINKTLRAVEKTVGIELKNIVNEKFLINKPSFPFGLKTEISDIEEIFLINEDNRYAEDKIKKRGINNSYTYQRKFIGKKTETGFQQELRKPLTSLQYVMLRQQRVDPNFNPVIRQRIHFVYNDLSYSVDVYNNACGEEKVYLLRFSNNQRDDPKQLIPSFLDPIKDVRQDPVYTLRKIAQKV